MIPPEEESEGIRSALDALDGLFEQADEHSDTAALTCPTMNPEVLEMVGEFLAAAMVGDLTSGEVRSEARMWLEMALAGWPFGSPTALVLVRALRMLAELAQGSGGADQPDPPAGTPLERAIDAVVADPAARPALWKALWYGTVFLPVAEVDFDDDEHAVFRFVTVEIGGQPTILGFTTEERLDLVVPPDEPIGRVEPTGEELARLWPEGHWLILNPGFSVSTVLDPGEVKGLPDGPTVFVPDELRSAVEAPTADDARLPALREARAAVDGVAALHWAVLRPESPGEARDVLVLRAGDPKQSQAVLASFSVAVTQAGFGNALVVAADPEFDAPLAARVMEVGVAVE